MPRTHSNDTLSRSTVLKVAAAFLALLLVAPYGMRLAYAEENAPQEQPQNQQQPQPEDADPATQPSPQLSEAVATACIDKAGNVVYELDGHSRHDPASTTKVMTAIVALDAHPKLSDVVTVQAPDLGENAQMGDYSTGDKVTLEELMRVMLVYSANDAAWNVATYIAGSEAAFVERMNAKAKELGLENTHFTNCHGLEEDEHYTCALDLAKIGRYALEHYPFIAQTVVMPSVQASLYGESITLKSTDRLLETFYGIRGIKTGAILNAYTFLGASGRGNVQLYCSVLGCTTFMGRFDDAASVMEWAYAHYTQKELTRAGWLVGVSPYAHNFRLSCAIHPTSDCNVQLWHDLGGLSYSTMQSRPSRLIDASTPCGWTNWSQANASVGSVCYASDSTPQQSSAWPIFSRPLFANTRGGGKA